MEMCVNKLCSRVAPLLNRMDDEILSGVGRKCLLQNDAGGKRMETRWWLSF